MKRIGIITIQKCNNFGADLQAYALGAKLRSMGYEAENIDYLFYKHPRHLKSGGKEKPVLPISFVNKVKEWLFPIVSTVRGGRSSATVRVRRERFDSWFLRNVLVGREYRSVNSLYDEPPQYDVYMVGSDQVWNPRMYSNIKPYFLDFAPEGARCVSYASSFGVSELPSIVFYRYKQWLKKFSAIGIREKKGAEMVRAMALGVEVKQVVDPTLLLTADEWARVAVAPENAPNEEYVLLYDLISCFETTAIASRIAAARGCRIVRIGDGAYGPGQFLWLFAHAMTVVTNSFHGTVFSILNHKPFFTVIPRTMSNAGRIESLVNSLGLGDRMIRAADVATFSQTSVDTDWESVNRRLEKLKDESVDFLKRVIDGPLQKIEHHLPIRCYAAWHKDGYIRAESTSGGGFSILATDIIKQGGVVYGAVFDDDFKHVHHAAATSLNGLGPIRKSKYVWSDPIAAYRDAATAVKNGKHVLFTGTPCQCAAIRKMIGSSDKLITVDFVCHGVPPPEAFEEYAIALERRYGGALVDYQFREKKDGWHFPRITYKFSNGVSKRIIPWLDEYYRKFSLSQNLREGCYRCPYANLERPSDITIADCWRVSTTNPKWDDNCGTSNVLINTELGLNFWHRVCENAEVEFHEYDLDLAQMRNHPLMMASSRVEKSRPLFYYWLVYWVKRVGWFYWKGKQ